MPISSSAATAEKKRAFRIQGKVPTVDAENAKTNKGFLTIGPALPPNDAKKLTKRSHSTLSAANLKKSDEAILGDAVILQTYADGTLHVSRSDKEREKNPDRLSLDRRGLSSVPIIDNESRLRLLSLQHNLVNSLDSLQAQTFPFLVFLDIYDNQLEKISSLESLENLRVLLMGKNRIKKIEGLDKLSKIEVLDLHGNQIQIVQGLSSLIDLKVLNLAGNQIKCIGTNDLHGLASLQELNLRRNKIKKLMGFGETPSLIKLFLSNNEIYEIEDMSSIAKSTCLREISVENNPVSLGGDCVSFLVAYLPQLISLNNMQVNEQVKKAAGAWRRNKESTNAAFMDLSSNISMNVRREEVISNARTNWELLRSQTRGLSAKTSVGKDSNKTINPENDFILTPLNKKPEIRMNIPNVPKRKRIKVPPVLLDKKLNMGRTSSQDTENSQNTSSSNASSSEFIRLPPILLPIINKLECRGDLKPSGSLSSIGPNVDSSVSSLRTSSRGSNSSSESSDSEEDHREDLSENYEEPDGTNEEKDVPSQISHENESLPNVQENCNVEIAKNNCVEAQDVLTSISKDNSAPQTDSSSVLSTSTISSITLPGPSASNEINSIQKPARNRIVKSALNSRTAPMKAMGRAATAKPKNKEPSPKCSSPGREREQGGDYLIEISGRHLNIYGQAALRYIDKTWNASKANDVTTVHFHYINFNNITAVLNRLKHRFINAEALVFKETNITHLGQLNALAEVQGLTHLTIEKDGNPVTEKPWESYAVYRLSHWGLKYVNGREIEEEDVKKANEEYKSLSDLVLWSLPDFLLQPLLVRLRIDVGQNSPEENAKKWLLSADAALQSVVSKEALQWKKGVVPQEDLQLRLKAKAHVGSMIDEMSNAIHKLRYLDQEWPNILHELVRNILLDYSQLDIYMKRKIQELK